MTNLNIFESVFKSADKATFAYRPVEIGSVLLVTDLEVGETDALLGQVRGFLSGISSPTPGSGLSASASTSMS